MKEYYEKVFPFDRVSAWLSYTSKVNQIDGSDYFRRREVSYNIASEFDDNEFVIRHLCYHNSKQFKADVISKVPLRIDIGAVFD